MGLKQQHLKVFQNTLKAVAKQLDSEECAIRRGDYLGAAVPSTLTPKQLDNLGGFTRLMQMYFPKPAPDIAVNSASRLVRGYKNNLDNQYGDRLFLKEEFLTVFKEVLSKNKIHLHKPVKPKRASKIPSRSMLLHISDTHFGCNISETELGGLNAFSWTIASRRMAALLQQAVTYKPQHRDNTELVICINGDIIAGVIHDQEWAVDLLTTQVAGTISILSQAITYAASHFNTIRVICTPGNHGRAMHKSSKDRAMTHKWDSYETLVYIALREICAAKHKNIHFTIPETPYAIFQAQGHLFFQTHGDTVINVGNPGKSLNMKSINEQINKANSQLIKGDKNFAGILVGHVHVPTVQMTDSGTMLLVNGTLSGLDAFAQSLGIYSNNPTQTLVEVVPEHAVGDIRLVQVKHADKDASLDKIISPFLAKL